MSAIFKQRIKALNQELSTAIKSTKDTSLEEFMYSKISLLNEDTPVQFHHIQLLAYGQNKENTYPPYISMDREKDKITIGEHTFIFSAKDYLSYQPLSLEHPILIMVLFITESGTRLEGLKDHISIVTKGIPYLKVYSDIDWLNFPDLRKNINNQCGRVVYKKLDNLQHTNLVKDVEEIGLTPTSSSILQTYRQLFHFESIITLFKQKISNTSIQQTAIQQQVKQEIKKNSLEMPDKRDALHIKQRIQSRVKTYEKQLSDFLEKELNGSIGRIPRLTNNQIDQLNNLEEKKGGKLIRFTIPDEFSTEVMKNFRQNLKASLIKEKDHLHSFAQSIEHQLAQFLEERNMKLPTRLGILPEEARIDQLLNSILIIDRKFEKTMSNRKMMDYFMGARLYYMIIFMGLSMFGMSGFMRSLGYFMIPVGTLLVGLGVFQVWSGQQRERADNKVKHLEEARDFLQNQFKKMAHEMERSWEKLAVGTLKRETDRLVLETERALAAREQLLKTKQSQTKNNLQAIDQSFLQKTRLIDNVDRMEINLKRNFDNLKKDIVKEIHKLFTNTLQQK